MTHDRFTGVGLGLRRPHLEAVAQMEAHGVPFWETCPENVVGDGGRHHRLAGHANAANLRHHACDRSGNINR